MFDFQIAKQSLRFYHDPHVHQKRGQQQSVLPVWITDLLDDRIRKNKLDHRKCVVR